MRGTLLLLVACGSRSTPRQTLAEVQKAVDQGDIAALRASLSEETIGFLRQKFGMQKADVAVAFMMCRLKPGMPLQIVQERNLDGDVLLKVRGGHQQNEFWGGELKFIRECGVWKFDLVEEFQAWEQLAEMVDAIGENMRQATPFLDEGVRRKKRPNRTQALPQCHGSRPQARPRHNAKRHWR